MVTMSWSAFRPRPSTPTTAHGSPMRSSRRSRASPANTTSYISRPGSGGHLARRLPANGYRRRVDRRLLAAGMIWLLVGCGSSSTRTVTSVPPVTTTTASRTVTIGASSAPTRCTDYLYGHSALVTFSSRSADVTAVCRSWIKVNARERQYWIQAAPGQAPSPAEVKRVCALQARKGRLTALVDSRPDDVYGRAACSGLISAGWVQQKAQKAS